MKLLLSILLVIFVAGCSVQVVEMSAQPTVQKFDLTDADADGVILAREHCTESFSGEKVDNNGCGVEKPVKVSSKLLVNFASDSSIVTPDFFDEIEDLADFMKEHPTADVTIEGHTSIVGSSAYNKKLSQERALAVKEILVNKFLIEEKRVSAVGYGFDRLLVGGNSPVINALNRRIVAVISSDKEIQDMKWTIYSVDLPEE